MKRQSLAQHHAPSLQQENTMLRGLLETFSRDAAHNHEVMQRFQERQLALLRAEDLIALLDCLTRDMRESFDLDCVKLVLFDPFQVIRDLLVAAAPVDKRLLRSIDLCSDIGATRTRFDDLHDPWIGPWNQQRHQPVFGRRIGGSVALLPLRQSDGLAGFLCLGSREPTRFQPEQATDCLAHLACLAAVCLENAVNRERLRLAGLTDSLTGLYNRRHLQHRIAQEVNRAQRYHQPLACLFVDADHFKQINDCHGHAAGDQVLQALAQRLRARLRASDLATRYGGEEFVVLLPQTDSDSARTLANAICSAVASEPLTLDCGAQLNVTVSVGVAALTGEETGPSQTVGATLLGAADQATYKAKQAGRNCVVCATQTSHD